MYVNVKQNIKYNGDNCSMELSSIFQNLFDETFNSLDVETLFSNVD